MSGIAERLRRWTYGDYDTHAVLSMAGEPVATVPLIAHAEALVSDAWQAANAIEAQDAEIARLRAALGGLLADTQHANHTCADGECPVSAARAALAPQETQP